MYQILNNFLDNYGIKNFILLDEYNNIISDNNNTTLSSYFILKNYNISDSSSFTIDGYKIVTIKYFESRKALLLIFNSNNEYITVLEQTMSQVFSVMAPVSPSIRITDSLRENNPSLSDYHINRWQLEIHFAHAFCTCNHKKLMYLIPKIFFYSNLEKYDFNHPTLVNSLISLVAILTRLSINEGASESKAYILSEKYSHYDFTTSVRSPLELVHKIVNDFVLLIEESQYKYGNPLINQAIHYIMNNLYSPISLKEIAKECGVSSEYLSSLFKKVTGLTFTKYITREKTKEAKFFLLKTDLSIHKIALDLGYSDQSHFSKIFKKQTGKSPSEFRKEFFKQTSKKTINL